MGYKKKGSVAVAMSGGVDSSVVAYLLKKEGYDIFGITMKHLPENEKRTSRSCCSLGDIYDAKKICSDLGIRHYTINLMEEFKKKVLDYFIEGYRAGMTPNPCVMCNKKVKLGVLLSKAKELGAEYLATGHYAIIKDFKLYPGLDSNKDQSYFLSRINRNNLKDLIFPLGALSKDEVRKKALEFRTIVAQKRDSSGICFIKSDFSEFFNANLKKEEKLSGEIVDKGGVVLGKHSGVHNFTIGQRRGINISAKEPYYVIKLDPKNNKVVVGIEEDLYTKRMTCNNFNALYDGDIKDFEGVKVYIKTRALDKMNSATIRVNGSSIEAIFEEPVRAVTPGQVAVVYSDKYQVLGGGIIL